MRTSVVSALTLLGLACQPRLLAEKKVIHPEGISRSASPLSPAIQTDHFTYVSGMGGRNPQGRYAKGDIQAQTRQALENIGAALKAAGLGFEHVVSTNLYLTDLRNLEAADQVYRRYFPRSFPARTTLEATLMSPDAMVEISAIAAHDLAGRRILSPEGWQAPASPISHAVLAGDTLFLSALRPADPTSGAVAAPDIGSQMQQILNNQSTLLKSADLPPADLVFSRIYLSDPGDYQGMNEVYRRFFTVVPPARATINTRILSDPFYLVEMQSVAVRGSGADRPSAPEHRTPIHSFSVKAGNRLYITGMTGRGPDGTFAKGNIKAQTRQALRTIEEQLRKHSMSFADVVDATVWLKDARQFAGMNEVYRQLVQPNPPARTTVRIPMNSPEALVEIMMVAVE